MGTRIDPNARFERERKRAKQDESTRQQQSREAIARKFASQGLQGSGADIKITQQVADEGAKRLDTRMGDISSLEEQSALQRQQVADARKFATEERTATEGFQSEQAGLAREQQQSQFAESLGLSKDQFEKQFGAQQTQFESSLALQQQQADLQKTLQEFQIGTDGEGGILTKQLDIAMQELEASKEANVFSAMLSAYNSKLTPTQMQKVLAPLGVEVDKNGSISYGGEVIFEVKPAATPTGDAPSLGFSGLF